MPWQFGMLGLTEDNGNRPIKYADALINGVCLLYFSCTYTNLITEQASPNDGFAIYKNESLVWSVFTSVSLITVSCCLIFNFNSQQKRRNRPRITLQLINMLLCT